MAVDAFYPHVAQRPRAIVERRSVGVSDAEFALLEACGYIRVGARVHVGVHAQADRRARAELPRDAVDALELARRFHVEAQNPEPQCSTNLVFGLADSGENHFCGIAAGCDDPLQLTAGDDVETAAEPAEHVEDREIGIRFHRIADEVIPRGESVGISTVSLGERRS
jgi:hypothetical protein